MQGIDVSSNNHSGGHPFNWHSAKAAGFNIVYVKATESTNYVNPYFIQDCKDARAAGFDVGLYHFYNTGRAVDQADYFVRNGINQLSASGAQAVITLKPCMDYEAGAGAPIASDVPTFCNRVTEQCGQPVCLYENRYFYGVTGLGPADYLWLAWPGWTGEPLPPKTWMVQVGTALVPGIGINSDGICTSETDINQVLNIEGMKLVAAPPPGPHLAAPVVGAATTPDGKGYWEVAADGGVFAYGDARFYGSMGGKTLNQPVVGIMSSPSGQGYALVAADGGMFCYGDFEYHGSIPGDGVGPAAASFSLNNPEHEIYSASYYPQ